MENNSAWRRRRLPIIKCWKNQPKVRVITYEAEGRSQLLEDQHILRQNRPEGRVYLLLLNNDTKGLSREWDGGIALWRPER